MLTIGSRHRPPERQEDPYAALVRVHHSPAYDLLVSLRALYNPRTYDAARAWTRQASAALSDDFHRRARFFFAGFDTALGYGGARLIPSLPIGAEPKQLIAMLRKTDSGELAIRMLDTGDTSDKVLAIFREHLEVGVTKSQLDRALRGLPAEWTRRCRRILADPGGVAREYIELLSEYLELVFGAEVPFVASATAAAAGKARQLLDALPTVDAIERLTGGYTLGAELDLASITVAPSLFVYPFMSARVDERAREALVIYGVASDAFSRNDPLHVDPTLTRMLKALADPSRLRIVRLVADKPMFGPEIVAALALSQPTVHHHIAQLRAARLVRQERAKGGMRYSLRRESLDAYLTELKALILGAE
jgi:DNA-binding transcriptional ArsR family regulator